MDHAKFTFYKGKKIPIKKKNIRSVLGWHPKSRCPIARSIDEIAKYLNSCETTKRPRDEIKTELYRMLGVRKKTGTLKKVSRGNIILYYIDRDEQIGEDTKKGD
jgi:hypothetical protein